MLHGNADKSTGEHTVTDQEEELRQIELDNDIHKKAYELYELLNLSDREEAEELRGHIAELYLADSAKDPA